MQQKVSVVMCTYNGAKFIRKQLDTIIAQTYPLYEILIFDDASTDDTFSILYEYSQLNSLIKLFKNEKNIGYSANFKQALLSASGEIIVTADQDDIWVVNKIEKMLSRWDDDSMLIYCNSARTENDISPRENISNPIYKRFKGKDAKKIFLFNTVSGHAMMIKKELLKIAFPFSATIYYDWWLAVIAAYNGGVNYLDEVLVYQRVHTQNISINDGTDHKVKTQRNAYKRMAIKHLHEFKKATNIPPQDKLFIEKLKTLLEVSLQKKFYLPLMVFLLKHKQLLFFHKNKKVHSLSYIKYAYRLTRNYGY